MRVALKTDRGLLHRWMKFLMVVINHKNFTVLLSSSDDFPGRLGKKVELDPSPLFPTSLA